jgi:hypothetical protein
MYVFRLSLYSGRRRLRVSEFGYTLLDSYGTARALELLWNSEHPEIPSCMVTVTKGLDVEVGTTMGPAADNPKIRNEKSILAMCRDFGFITHFIEAWQDRSSLYILVGSPSFSCSGIFRASDRCPGRLLVFDPELTG